MAKYVLPKFKVSIEAPDHVVMKEYKISAVVRGDYTYGKPMNGRAIVKLIEDSVLSEKTIEIVNGKGEVEFEFDAPYASELTIEASVTEDFTGLIQSCTKVVKLHEQSYSVTVKTVADYFIPEEPFKIMVTVNLIKFIYFATNLQLNFSCSKVNVKNHDGSVVHIDDNTKKISVLKSEGSSWNDNSDITYHCELDSNGMLQLTVCHGDMDYCVSYRVIFVLLYS